MIMATISDNHSALPPAEYDAWQRFWMTLHTQHHTAVLQRITDLCTNTLGADYVALVGLNDATGQVMPSVLYGSQVAPQYERAIKDAYTQNGPPTQAALVHDPDHMRLPLWVDARVVGLLVVGGAACTTWDEHQHALVMSLADTAALFIDKLVRQQQLEHNQHLQQATYRIAQLLNDDLSLNNVLEKILENLRALFPISGAAVMLTEPDKTLRLAAETSLKRVAHARERLAFGEGLIGKVAETRQATLTNQYKASRYALSDIAADNELQTALGVPLLIRDNLVGVLALFQVSGDDLVPLTQADVTLLEGLAPLAAMVIENTQLRESVRQERAQLQAVLDYVPVPILLFDHKSRLVLANPTAHNVGRRVGLLLYSLIGSTLQDILGQLPPEADIPQNLGYDTMQEINLGEGGHFLATMARVPHLLGGASGNVVVLQEVTEERRLNEARSSLLGILSHDLGNKLSLSLGYAALLIDEEQTPEDQETFIENIYNSLEEARTLIRNVVEIEYAESQGQHITKPYALPVILHEIYRSLWPAARDKQQTLHMVIPDEFDMPLIGNDALMKQALENLVSNALKYTPAGGEVHVVLDTTDTYARVRVSDTGIGIPQEELGNIWQRFYRVHRDETKNIEGTGLGLTLVESVIRGHGGHIATESTIGQGTTFTIYLPFSNETDA